MTSSPPPVPQQPHWPHRPHRPGRAALKWGIGLLLAAVLILGVSVAGGFFAIRGMLDSEQLFVAGEHELVLDEPGTYVIYHEHQTVVGGQIIRQQFPPADLEVTVSDPAGRQLELRSPRGSSSYSIGTRQGQSLFAFEADQPGTYTLRGETDLELIVLTVRRGFLRQVGGFALAICSLSMAILMAIAGTVLVIIGLVQRYA